MITVVSTILSQLNLNFGLFTLHLQLKLNSLQQKLSAVKEWAQSLKINLQTRLLSEQSLSQQSISPEDLNRFYLNGLVLAAVHHYGGPLVLNKKNQTMNKQQNH